jgi:hypothetical protein
MQVGIGYIFDSYVLRDMGHIVTELMLINRYGLRGSANLEVDFWTHGRRS